MNKEPSVCLNTSYLGPIQHYAKLMQFNHCIVEVYDHYGKQSYRNRCNIYGANGLLPLSVPIKKDRPKVYTKDILIDYDTNWRKMHWKGIESAYQSSPFFEFYRDDFLPFYEKKYLFLIDFNMDLEAMILDFLEIDCQVEFSDHFIQPGKSTFDYRDVFHPKKKRRGEDAHFKPVEYPQVFDEKHGFIPNLSIIDLLFNEGPNASLILESCIQ